MGIISCACMCVSVSVSVCLSSVCVCAHVCVVDTFWSLDLSFPETELLYCRVNVLIIRTVYINKLLKSVTILFGWF